MRVPEMDIWKGQTFWLTFKSWSKNLLNRNFSWNSAELTKFLSPSATGPLMWCIQIERPNKEGIILKREYHLEISSVIPQFGLYQATCLDQSCPRKKSIWSLVCDVSISVLFCCCCFFIFCFCSCFHLRLRRRFHFCFYFCYCFCYCSCFCCCCYCCF